MSELYQNLFHSKWDCKYHVVFIPRRRRKVVFGKMRQQLGEIFHALARQKGRARSRMPGCVVPVNKIGGQRFPKGVDGGERIAGLEVAIPVVLVEVTMEVVGAGLQD